jgi:hypothetical protein
VGRSIEFCGEEEEWVGLVELDLVWEKRVGNGENELGRRS